MGVSWCLLFCLTLQTISMSSGNGITLPFMSFKSTSRPVKPSPTKASSPATPVVSPFEGLNKNALQEKSNGVDTIVNKPSSNAMNINSILHFDPFNIKSATMDSSASSNIDASSILPSTSRISDFEIPSPIFKTAYLNTPILKLASDNNNTEFKKLQQNSFTNSPVSVFPNICSVSYKAPIEIKPPLVENVCFTDDSATPQSFNSASSSKTINSPSFLSKHNISTCIQTLPESSFSSIFLKYIDLLSNVLPKCPFPSKLNDLPEHGLSLPIAASVQSITLNCLSSSENSCPVATHPESLSSSLYTSPGSLPSVNIIQPGLKIRSPNLGTNFPGSSLSIPILLESSHVLDNSDYSNVSSSTNAIKSKECSSEIVPDSGNGRPIFNSKISNSQPIINKLSSLSVPYPNTCNNLPPLNTVSNISDNSYAFPSNYSPIGKSTFTASCYVLPSINNVSSPVINRNVVSPTVNIRNSNFSSPTCPTISYLPSPTLPCSPYSGGKYSTLDSRPSSFMNDVLSLPLIPNVSTFTLPPFRPINNSGCILKNMLHPSNVNKSTPSIYDPSETKLLSPVRESYHLNILEPYPFTHYKPNTFVPPKVPGAFACQSIAPNIFASPKVTPQIPFTLATTANPTKALVKPQIEYISTSNVVSSINDMAPKIAKIIMDSIIFNIIQKNIPTTTNIPRKNTIIPKSTKPVVLPISLPAVKPNIKPVVTYPISIIPSFEINTLSLLDNEFYENSISDTDDYLLSNIMSSKCNIQSESILMSSKLLLPIDEEEDIIIDLSQPKYLSNEVNASEGTLDNSLIVHLLKSLDISDLVDTKDDEYIDLDAVEEIYISLYDS